MILNEIRLRKALLSSKIALCHWQSGIASLLMMKFDGNYVATGSVMEAMFGMGDQWDIPRLLLNM